MLAFPVSLAKYSPVTAYSRLRFDKHVSVIKLAIATSYQLVLLLYIQPTHPYILFLVFPKKPTVDVRGMSLTRLGPWTG